MYMSLESGVATSLGNDSQVACAAARAGISRISELQCLNFSERRIFGAETLDGFPPVNGHVAAGITAGSAGRARAVELGASALANMLAKRKLSQNEISQSKLFFNSNDGFLDRSTSERPDESAQPVQNDRTDSLETLGQVFAHHHLELPQGPVVQDSGHAGAISMLQAAIKELNAGARHCIVGAIDSFVTPQRLFEAASLRLLKTGDNPCGFLPGEAAVFCLLERQSTPNGLQLHSFATAQDEWNLASEDPPLGVGLASVILETVTQGSKQGCQIGFTIGDLNGVEYRAMDWGNAVRRIHSVNPVANLPLWLPAISFGETGAAAGLLSLVMAEHGFARGHAPSQAALLWLSSDMGQRSSCIVNFQPRANVR